jgi:hypothetical protein
MTEDADGLSLSQWAAEIQGSVPDPVPTHPLERGGLDKPEPSAADPAPEASTADPAASGETPAAPESVAAEASETAADPETTAAAEAPKPAKGKAKPLEPWVKDRLAEVTAQRRAAEKALEEERTRAAVLNAELEALRRRAAEPAADGAPKPPDAPTAAPKAATALPQDEIERRAQQLAADRDLNARANATYEAGKAAFPDFDEALAPLQEMGAFTQPSFYDAVFATDAPEAVIHYLGSNPNEGSRVLGFLKAGQAVKAAAEMTKIATKIEAEKAAAKTAAVKRVSQAPAPIRAVGGSAVPQPLALDKLDDAAFDVEFGKMARQNGWY